MLGERIAGSLTHRLEPFVLAEPSSVVAPFIVEGRWGAIAVAAQPEVEYGTRELDLLGGLAHQAKLAIANASSFEGLERTFLSTVEALANALEARDEYTSSHARWITDTALLVGQELGLDGDTLKRLELGALFHDIGKIGIPNSILLKPGPLTRGGARADRDAPRARREDHRPDRPAAGRLRDRARVPRALGRRRLSRPQGRRGDPARGADHLRLRRVPRDDDRPPLPAGARSRRRRCGGSRKRPGRSSTRASSRSACACSSTPRARLDRRRPPSCDPRRWGTLGWIERHLLSFPHAATAVKGVVHGEAAGHPIRNAVD